MWLINLLSTSFYFHLEVTVKRLQNYLIITDLWICERAGMMVGVPFIFNIMYQALVYIESTIDKSRRHGLNH